MCRTLYLLAALGVVAAQHDQLLADRAVARTLPFADPRVRHHSLHLVTIGLLADGVAALAGVYKRMNIVLDPLLTRVDCLLLVRLHVILFRRDPKQATTSCICPSFSSLVHCPGRRSKLSSRYRVLRLKVSRYCRSI